MTLPISMRWQSMPRDGEVVVRASDLRELEVRIEGLEAALQFYAEQDDVNNYVAVAALSTQG
jgi:hypothetical protein